MTTPFTPEQIRRWDEWRQANARAARLTDVRMRAFGILAFAAVLVAQAVAVWQR